MAERILGHEVLGFVDNFKTADDNPAVLGSPSELRELLARHAGTAVAFAIGYHNMAGRAENFDLLQRTGVPILSLVHPSANVDPTV